MNNLTFVIFTYNEEKRIERVIKNFCKFGKILIADNNSTDLTVDIARKLGCDVYTRTKNYVYVENQELVDALYKEISTDWIYWGFADEMLEIGTLEKIVECIKADSADIITMDRKNYYYGRFCYNMFHARTNKIFKKHALNFSENKIHGTGVPTVSSGRIYGMPENYYIHHFISNTAASYINVVNRYSDAEVETPVPAKKSIGWMMGVFVKVVIREFFLHRGYKAGFAGVALLQSMLTYIWLTNVKHFERAENLDTAEIEVLNDRKRDAILEGFN